MDSCQENYSLIAKSTKIDTSDIICRITPQDRQLNMRMKAFKTSENNNEKQAQLKKIQTK